MKTNHVCPRLASWLLVLLIPTPMKAQEAPYAPRIMSASDEAELAIARFQISGGLQAEVFAAEPLLAHPVAIGIDRSNRLYVAETFRLHAGVSDIRGHMSWLERDLASRTVEDRVAMYRHYLSREEFDRWGREHDRIRRIVDQDGDGVADESTVFADGFQGQETGIGAGILARDGTVWYTNIPHLWKLADLNDDGIADRREILSTGYGVHMGFLGHDLHGAILGPDGLLYVSIGDRGLNVESGDPQTRNSLFLPDTGAVLRCDPSDGRSLEIVATGLRNPQELAFNEFGDLFTVDNNSDGGDQARLVHVVEGGDSGWRIGYQFMSQPVTRGPWNAEKLWRPLPENTAAYLLPPLANISDGPSGLVYDPGVTQLPESYRGHFFLADFRGSPGQSGIRAFTVEPDGASYRFVQDSRFLWGLEATDLEFGVEGALYIADWVEGWGLTGKGRIYRLSDPSRARNPELIETATILKTGLADRREDELSALLAHDDMRVRQDAQFELVRRAREELTGTAAGAIPAFLALQNTAKAPSVNGRARRHAIWGIGQLSRSKIGPSTPVLVSLLDDADPEVRTQAARSLRDGAWTQTGRHDVVRQTTNRLIRLLEDDSPRAQAAAAMALGQPGETQAIMPLFDLLRRNKDQDVYLRHAAVMALARIGDEAAIASMVNDPSRSVRLGVLLALRKLESPEVRKFLNDHDDAIVLEAARAIHDVPIPDASPDLAELAIDGSTPEPLARRVVHANLRIGGPEHAGILAHLASAESVAEAIRIEALQALSEWADPPDLDPIVGLWRPMGPRSSAPAREALGDDLVRLIQNSSSKIQAAAARTAAALEARDAIPALLTLVGDTDGDSEVRQEALRSLESLEAPGLAETASQLLGDGNRDLRSLALSVLSKLDPVRAIPGLRDELQTADLRSRQRAFETLGRMDIAEADDLLAAWLDRMARNDVPPEIQLDLIEAASNRSAEVVTNALAKIEKAGSADDPLARYRMALVGGNYWRGFSIFRDKTEVSCLRCHKFNGDGGEVGPDLTGIGAKKDREYLLRSIVMPDAEIAEGFETVVLALADGQVVSGVARGSEDDMTLVMTPEGELKRIPESEIEDRAKGISAMPQDLVQQLSMREIRDLVEFLSRSTGVPEGL